MLRRLETDRELLERYATGDERCFEVLYRRHRRRLWEMAKKMGRDPQQAAVDSLPREEGLAVYLVDCQGFTYKECAEALSCSEATVKRRLREARRRLAMRLSHLRPQFTTVEAGAEG